MRRQFVSAALVMGVAVAAFAAGEKSAKVNSEADSLKVNDLDEVVVKAVTVKKDAPFAVARIDRAQLEEFDRTGRELPFLFARTPGVVAWSENGLGTGTSYLRIRGMAGSRINVTLDGVALNSPEDECVFWANMNSYASFLGSAQIQRGVGTSTNGDGAFGGSIALKTLAPSYAPSAEITGAGGSYGTWRAGGRFSTGLTGIKLKKHYLVLDGAYHHTGTQGYIHGTDGNSGSYYGALTFINEKGNLKLSYKNVGNYEHTGLAWNGVTAGDNDNSLIEGSNINWNSWPAGVNHTGIVTYKDMYKAGLGRFNSLYERLLSKDGVNSFADENGVYHTERYAMSDGSLWPRTTDNFWQNHSLLNLTWRINDRWSTTATLHYTRGEGYYEEFRYQNKFAKFGIALSREEKAQLGIPVDSKGRSKADFVRQKGLVQNTAGAVWNFNYTDKRWDVQFGASVQNFDGNHYGYLTYTSMEGLNSHLGITADGGKYKYYDSDADKNDESAFAKAQYKITDALSVFGDVQWRHVGFHTNGINDKFVALTKDESLIQTQRLDINKNYNFCNPKAGISFNKKGHSAYVSYALSHREPERNNFTDNGSKPLPEPESVHDVELGYGFTAHNWYVMANLYGMFYRNQFVQTGELSDIGESLTTNIKSSYRMGIELSAGYSPLKWLSIEANAALSRNRILDFDEVMSIDWEDEMQTVHYDNSTLAFSPSAIVNGFLDFHYKGFKGVWHTSYVSRQYLDNTQCDLRSLPQYTTTDIHLTYDWKLGGKCLKNVVFGADLNNIFNSHHAQSGWVYSSLITDNQTGGPVLDRYTQIGWVPSAGFTAMGSVTLKF